MANNEKQRLLDLAEKRNSKEYDWMKNAVVSASTFLGILISLHTKPSKDIYTHYLFSLGIVIIAVGILSGSIYLYSDTSTHHRLLKKIADIQKGTIDGHLPPGVQVLMRPYKIFNFMRYVALISFFLAIPTLVIYAITMDKA